MLLKIILTKVIAITDVVRNKKKNMKAFHTQENFLSHSHITRINFLKVHFVFGLMRVKINYNLVISRIHLHPYSRSKTAKKVQTILSIAVRILLILFYTMIRNHDSIW